MSLAELIRKCWETMDQLDHRYENMLRVGGESVYWLVRNSMSDLCNPTEKARDDLEKFLARASDLLEKQNGDSKFQGNSPHVLMSAKQVAYVLSGPSDFPVDKEFQQFYKENETTLSFSNYLSLFVRHLVKHKGFRIVDFPSCFPKQWGLSYGMNGATFDYN